MKHLHLVSLLCLTTLLGCSAVSEIVEASYQQHKGSEWGGPSRTTVGPTQQPVQSPTTSYSTNCTFDQYSHAMAAFYYQGDGRSAVALSRANPRHYNELLDTTGKASLLASFGKNRSSPDNQNLINYHAWLKSLNQ